MLDTERYRNIPGTFQEVSRKFLGSFSELSNYIYRRYERWIEVEVERYSLVIVTENNLRTTNPHLQYSNQTTLWFPPR